MLPAPHAFAAAATPWLKVCGLRRPEQAAAVAALGVEAIGVIAVARSPRWLEPADRPGLFAAMAEGAPACRGVLVVADPADSELELLGPGLGHQVLQLHGDETPERCQQLRSRFGPELLLWKALRVRSAADLQRVAAYRDVVDGLLLDAWVPDQLGGTGHRIPTEWLQGFSAPLPWWLAGGITPERIGPLADALAGCLPQGLDASSGVERSPGDKDLDRVAQLVAAVRAVRQDRAS